VKWQIEILLYNNKNFCIKFKKINLKKIKLNKKKKTKKTSKHTLKLLI